jgi:RimJ/RimL family protein N-acetyltransferase
MPESSVPSDRVRLRDVTLDDADLVDAWDANRSPFNDFGMPHEPIDREAIARGPLRNERNGMLIVERVEDGRPIGTVGWHRESYGPNAQSTAFNLGIELIPEARGQGYGSEAQAQLAAYLFATSDVNRVEAATDLENVAEQRSLERAGFRREGVLRGSQFRGGRYHDLVYYAVLRQDIGLPADD